MFYNKQNGKSSFRVCVVGAGAAGICAARRVVEELPRAEVCVFEQSDQLGGTWVFTEQSSPETHSSMYAGLRTNIPKEIMNFSGFPIESVDFPDHHNPDDSFPRHEVILSYLQRFAEPIKHLVQYNLRIASIVPVERKDSDNSEFKWRINAERVPGKQKFVEYFDVVFVCTGHYWCPRIPDFANKFRTTRWAHSHSYRRAQHFAGMRVAVVGANLSGVEIALQLTEHVEKVYLINSSQRTVIEKSTPANSLLELNGSRVMDVVDDSLVLADGRMIGGLDFVLFCTGYCFNFPFFDQSQKNSSVIFCDGNFVSPLIGHVAHPDYLKALFFIGLNLLVDPFPCFDVQVRIQTKKNLCRREWTFRHDIIPALVICSFFEEFVLKIPLLERDDQKYFFAMLCQLANDLYPIQTHFALALLKDRVPNASERFTMEMAKHWEQKRIKLAA